jgi:hypothetical protein
MQRLELQGLLVPAGSPGQPRAEVVNQLMAASAGPATADNFKDVAQQISALTAQLGGLNSSEQTQTTATQDNTQALSQNTATKGSGSSVGSTVGSIASSLFGGGLSPILSGLIGLFSGGGSSQTTTVLPRFQLPAPVQYQAGLSGASGGSGVQPVDQGQGGQVRTQSANPAPQINIQVNALDSQSFLDHSDEIAQAVKAAMLSSSSLNDIIADL